MAADRRYTNWDGSGFTDENVKVSSLVCLNARLAIGFAGLARAPGFETATWLLETLSSVGKPDYDGDKIVDRFREAATRDFAKLPVDRRFRRSTFLFAGIYGTTPCFARVSNYEHEGVPPLEVASEEFSSLKRSWSPVTGKELSIIATAGNPIAMSPVAIDELKAMLKQRKPPKAAANKTIDIIRDAADDFRSGGSIGSRYQPWLYPAIRTCQSRRSMTQQ